MKDTLPTWDGGGHLTDVALMAIADGQHDLVEPTGHAHLETCEACAAKLADLALQSIAVGDALVRSRMSRKLPVAAVAIAMVLALVGIVPSVLEPGRIADLMNIPRSIPMFLSALASGLHTVAQGPLRTVATFAAALLLVVFGALIARKRAVRSS